MAPKDMQLVVYHTAVLGYVSSQSDREAFAETVGRTSAVWLSNEVPSVFPELTRMAPPSLEPGHFLLAVNGKPVAWTGPHGQSIDWFAAEPFRLLNASSDCSWATKNAAPQIA